MTPKVKKILIISSVAVGVLGLTALGIFIYKRLKNKGGSKNNLLKKSNKTLVCSHITSVDSPQRSKAENNLRNIALLLDSDVDMIEMDVQITKDGVPVLYHDNTLDGKTNGSGSISDKTWSEVSQFRYKKDTTQGITKLEDAITVLKKSGRKTIFQLDKCNAGEIQKINALGLFKGVENQMLAKAQSFTKSDAVVNSGIMYMPIIPSSYVGKMNNDSTIDEIVSKCRGSNFLEAQFNTADSKLIDGTLSNKLSAIDCRLLIVAVGGTQDTQASTYRGDNQTAWGKMLNPTKAGVIMTNNPIACKQFIETQA